MCAVGKFAIYIYLVLAEILQTEKVKSVLSSRGFSPTQIGSISKPAVKCIYCVRSVA